jgi:hypothetical protein
MRLRDLWPPLPRAVPPLAPGLAIPPLRNAALAYRLRWRRRQLLWRAFRRRHQIAPVADRTAAIRPGQVLAFACLRDEGARLPHFLAHHRRLGVAHFLIVDNGSTDGSAAWLARQDDVSLWHTGASYKGARFGLDWVTVLMARHGHGHWCLTLDADELFVYPHWETRPLPALTAWLDDHGAEAMAAMMLDLYPRGRLGAQDWRPGDDPLKVLEWFDAGNYSLQVQPRLGNTWIQGGPRARVLLEGAPRRAPTLNKIPLVRWNRRHVYVNSTHALLPRRLNRVWDGTGGEAISGLLLHTKFLPQILDRSAVEKARREHFAHAPDYDSYYDGILAAPDLWCPASTRLTGGWRQLEGLGLMSRGGWM